MTQVQSAPPKFVVFVNNPILMVESYRKYLVNRFREAYQFSGCPIEFELRGKPKAQSIPNKPVPELTGTGKSPLLIDQVQPV